MLLVLLLLLLLLLRMLRMLLNLGAQLHGSLWHKERMLMLLLLLLLLGLLLNLGAQLHSRLRHKEQLLLPLLLLPLNPRSQLHGCLWNKQTLRRQHAPLTHQLLPCLSALRRRQRWGLCLCGSGRRSGVGVAAACS